MPSGEALGCVGGSRSEGECRQEPLLWLLQEGTQEAACTGLGMASLINFGGFREKELSPAVRYLTLQG